MNVLRGVEDMPAFERGMSNTTTARALAEVMAAIRDISARVWRGGVSDSARRVQ